jgi:hypothetical protein
MAKIRKVQASYVSGEFDPTLLGRVDIDDYAQGADKLRNVYVRPQGGAFRREGLDYFDGVNNNNKARLIPFQFNDEQTYILVFTAGRMDVYRTDSKTLQTSVTSSPIDGITDDILSEINWTQSADSLILFHKDLQPVEVSRTSDTVWTATSITFENIPPFAYGALTKTNPAGSITPDVATGIVTVTATGTPFTSADVGQFINTSKGGRILITEFTDTSHVNGIVRVELAGTDAISSGDWEVESGYEPVMSATRGWARSGTFHKSRLVLGGLSQRPQTILMSKIGEFFNLDIGESLDDEAIDVTIDDDKVNIIRNVYSGNSLTVLTSGGEYSIRGNIDNAITPSNIADQVSKETRHGSSKVRPVSLDGAVIFVEREDPNDSSTGRIVRQFVFNETEQSFNAPNVSVFSQHLIANPVAMDIRSSTESHPSNYLYMVNGDGTCAVLNSLREQSLLAWTLFETQGLFEDVAVSGNKTFFIVQRTIAGQTVRQLEVLNADNRLDSSLTQTDTDTNNWSGLDYLNGQEVWVIGNDQILEKETPSAGSLTSSESVSKLEAGLAFFARVKHLPLEIQIQGQSWAGEFKNPVFANVRVYQSREFIVKNGDQVSKPALEEFASEYTEGNATLYSKWQKVYIGGAGREAQPEITQEVPLELNVLATHFAVRVS